MEASSVEVENQAKSDAFDQQTNRVHVTFLHRGGCQRGGKEVEWSKSSELFVMSSKNAESKREGFEVLAS